MEINSTNFIAALRNSVQKIDTVSGVGRIAGAGKTDADSDRLDLSVQSHGSLRIKEINMSSQDIRESRVEAIRVVIANGTYNVNAKQVAEKIINGSLLNEVV